MVIEYIISIHGARELVDKTGNKLEENYIAFCMCDKQISKELINEMCISSKVSSVLVRMFLLSMNKNELSSLKQRKKKEDTHLHFL